MIGWGKAGAHAATIPVSGLVLISTPSDFRSHLAQCSPLLAAQCSEFRPRLPASGVEVGLELSGLPRWRWCLSPSHPDYSPEACIAPSLLGPGMLVGRGGF